MECPANMKIQKSQSTHTCAHTYTLAKLLPCLNLTKVIMVIQVVSNIKLLIIIEKTGQNVYTFLFNHLGNVTNSLKARKICKYNYTLGLLAWHASINTLIGSADILIGTKTDGFSLFG